MLQARIAGGGSPGFQNGDILTYIIQFTPVRNNANTGVMGYITDYIPAGTEVVGAAFVAKDASGNFYNISPSLPGGIASGWGTRGQKTFLAPFNVATYAPGGACTGAGAQCNARLTELHADTGIFYSTNTRTAVFPAPPARIAQGTNGYNIIPSAAGQLNPIIGQAAATTHNLWDADQTNAFGTANQGNITGLAAPKSAALYLGNAGTGATPFFAGSGVAGPQTGYQFDNTGNVGPWQRIAYTGSRIGNPTTGRAPAELDSETAVGGLPTSSGYSLSVSNPLPSATNAVRWAAGKLRVGEIKYVSISLRLTANPPTSGIWNQSEVFGGDAGDEGNGQDNVWRYHVPSVADSNSNLYVYKEPCQFDATATTCTPLLGSTHAANTTVTYRITYINTGAQAQTNVVLRDILPCYTLAGRTIRVGTVTGPFSTVISTPFVTTTASAGNCNTTPLTRYTVTFPTLGSLAPGAGGALIINVPNSAGTLGDVVVNTARLSSTDFPSGVSSNAVTSVGNATLPSFALQKITNTPASLPGGTVQYVIVLRNVGTGAATGIVIDDFLPTAGLPVDATRRFNFANLVGVQSTGFTTSTALVTSTQTAAAATVLAPYDTDAGAGNRVRVIFNFGATSSLAANGVITLTFNASVGANMPFSPPAYTNDVVARGTTGNTLRIDANSAAAVTLIKMANLAISKTNGTLSLVAGSTTNYTITVSNFGPSSAEGSIVRDTPSAGLNCPAASVTCPPAGLFGGAACPATPSFILSGGAAIPTFPANSSLSFVVQCGVTASGQ